MKKFLVIGTDILPEVYEKVLIAKELIRMKRVKGVMEAVNQVGISRSTFYKYKDFVFSLSGSSLTRKATIHFMLKHKSGVLAKILQRLAENNANILTIHQNIPINETADVSITIDISEVQVEVSALLKDFNNLEGVLYLELVVLE